MRSRGWLLAALAVGALASACDTFNTNLTTQTTSSVLTFVSPASWPAGGAGFTLTATGNGFVSGANVLWNGTALTTTFVNSTQLTAVVPAANVATAGTVQVVVQIPGSAVPGSSNSFASGTTELSNVVLFSVKAPPPPPPVITPPLSPASVAAGSAAFTLTVTGTGFVSGSNGSVIYWNGSPRTPTTVTGTTQASAQISPADVAVAGPAQVSISNAASGGSSSSAVTFTITGPGSAVSATSKAVSDAAWLGGASPGMSSDRRYVVFSMASTDGIVEIAGTAQNVFVRDTCAGAPAGCAPSTALVSIGTDSLAGNGDSSSPTISANARYIAFLSSATNLVQGDTNGVADVFVRDTCAGAPSGCTPSTERVSVASDGAQANDASVSASISASGRYITFRSLATNLDPASTSVVPGIFVRDVCVGAPDGCTPSTQWVPLRN
jgi:IPT/TIG domain-containing protein